MGGGGKKGFGHAESGGTNSFEIGLTQELEVLAIVIGERKMFQPFKRGAQKVLPCLEGGGAKSFRPAIFPLCSPPPPFP